MIDQATVRTKNRTLHEGLVDSIVASGWQRNGWRKAVPKKLRLRPWNEEPFDGSECEWCHEAGDATPEECAYCHTGNEMIEAFLECRCLPDCWRLKVEMPLRYQWHHPVLILEALEVCIYNDISEDKLIMYENLWWAFDASTRLHFRLFRMNRDATISTVFDSADSVLIRLKPNKKKPELKELWKVYRATDTPMLQPSA